MILENESLIPLKTKNTVFQNNIHNLFIFNRAGICLYERKFTNIYEIKEKQLISSFFSALMSFSKQILGKVIKIIEMEGIKFVVIEMNQLYYGVLCDSIENLILLEDIIQKINAQFIKYVNENKVDLNLEYVYDDILDANIDKIVTDVFNNEFTLNKEKEIINFLDNIASSDEIKGIILLTNKGKLIYSTFNKINLRHFLTEVDFRVKITNNSILKLFYTSKNNELIFSDYIDDSYFIILVFGIDTKFGVAEYLLAKTTNFIKKIINMR